MVDVMLVVTMMVVMMHRRGKRGVCREQQQSGNDGYLLHDGELYLEIFGPACPGRRAVQKYVTRQV